MTTNYNQGDVENLNSYNNNDDFYQSNSNGDGRPSSFFGGGGGEYSEGEEDQLSKNGVPVMDRSRPRKPIIPSQAVSRPNRNSSIQSNNEIRSNFNIPPSFNRDQTSNIPQPPSFTPTSSSSKARDFSLPSLPFHSTQQSISQDSYPEDDVPLGKPNPSYARPSSFYGLEGHQRQQSSSATDLRLQSTRPGSADQFSSVPSNSGRRFHNGSPSSISSLPIKERSSSAGNLRDQSGSYHDDFAPPAPLLDHSHLQPGTKAKLLGYDTTLEQYRANAKKTNDPDLVFEFACFVMEVVRELDPKKDYEKRENLIQESTSLLNRLANRGHVQAQYLLGDLYTQGIGTNKGKRDYDKAFPLFILAAKHGHSEACFRAGQCCEHGWGCRKETAKALQFYRKAAALSHPTAMYRLGLAELNGELHLSKRPKEGVKWLKRAAELADSTDPPQPQALHELALIHEKGIENVVLQDNDYAAELLARAAELGWAPSAYKLGECYEYGKMGCPQDAPLSIHYYNIAAQQDHPEACFALTAWYLVGSPGVLPQSDTEAYLWARKAADKGLPKAEYAVGYFTEVGIGTPKDQRDALVWFRKAATHGDKRAIQRLKQQSPSEARYGEGGALDKEFLQGERGNPKKGKKGTPTDGDCIIA